MNSSYVDIYIQFVVKCINQALRGRAYWYEKNKIQYWVYIYNAHIYGSWYGIWNINNGICF